jgi:protein subunit release factor A
MLAYAAIGAGILIALLSAGVAIQTHRVEAAKAATAAIAVQLDDVSRKLARQNSAVDELAEKAELARAQRDQALERAAKDIRAHESKADALRARLTRPVAPAKPGLSAPATPSQSRDASTAIAEFRRTLKP